MKHWITPEELVGSLPNRLEDEPFSEALQQLAGESAPCADELIDTDLSNAERKVRENRWVHRRGTSLGTWPEYRP